MRLFKISYEMSILSQGEKEAYILCEGLPSQLRILKRINMLNYCGKEMTNKDYKEFVLDAGNYTSYDINNVEEIEFIKF